MVQTKPVVAGMSVNVIELAKITDARGSLGFVETGKHVPFEIRRVFYIYGVPKGVKRGGHAHKKCKQMFIVLQGSADIATDDGKSKSIHSFSGPTEGLYVPERTWVEMQNISEGAVIIVMCSEHYDPDDYVKDYVLFIGEKP